MRTMMILVLTASILSLAGLAHGQTPPDTQPADPPASRPADAAGQAPCKPPEMRTLTVAFPYAANDSEMRAAQRGAKPLKELPSITVEFSLPETIAADVAKTPKLWEDLVSMKILCIENPQGPEDPAKCTVKLRNFFPVRNMGNRDEVQRHVEKIFEKFKINRIGRGADPDALCFMTDLMVGNGTMRCGVAAWCSEVGGKRSWRQSVMIPIERQGGIAVFIIELEGSGDGPRDETGRVELAGNLLELLAATQFRL